MNLKINVKPVILCGGSGTRLWPLSRAGFPKQFLNLTGDLSLFQLTAKRLEGLASNTFKVNPLIIISGEDHRFIVKAQLAEIAIKDATLVLEPCPKNTAPALTLAALASSADDSDPVLVVMPSDQVIFNNEAFRQAISSAIIAANDGSIITLGIKPNNPETGYGYIKVKGALGSDIFSVVGFFEKPNKAKAEEYLKCGDFFWNSGIFILKASVWLSAINRYHSEIATKTKLSWQKRKNDPALGNEVIRICEEDFKEIPAESIDYAVMEHGSDKGLEIKMISLESVGWNDLGVWDAVWGSLPKDINGNATIGDVILFDVKDTYVHAESRLVSLVGVENIAIIETSDAILVVDRKRSQEVKKVVSFLNDNKRQESYIHRKVHRPWGYYDAINEGENFKVKRISVNPGASLSLQKHSHRSEHWVVVKGVAEVLCGDKTEILQANSSLYIPAGQIHRLSNPSVDILEIIEVQTGEYLGEDDIVRLDDNYGRE
jgi:mannose-1-phosphate guanylyltransferase / mannose-6-phosphate isomerase